LPLYERVKFSTKLQRGNRIQVSKYVRWRYKLETSQTLQVTVSAVGVFCSSQVFLARMGKDGRITIPKLNLNLLQDRKADLTGYAMAVTLEPF